MPIAVNIIIIKELITYSFPTHGSWTTDKSRSGFPPAPFKCRNPCHNLWFINYHVLSNSRPRKFKWTVCPGTIFIWAVFISQTF